MHFTITSSNAQHDTNRAVIVMVPIEVKVLGFALLHSERVKSGPDKGLRTRLSMLFRTIRPPPYPILPKIPPSPALP